MHMSICVSAHMSTHVYALSANKSIHVTIHMSTHMSMHRYQLPSEAAFESCDFRDATILGSTSPVSVLLPTVRADMCMNMCAWACVHGHVCRHASRYAYRHA